MFWLGLFIPFFKLWGIIEFHVEHLFPFHFFADLMGLALRGSEASLPSLCYVYDLLLFLFFADTQKICRLQFLSLLLKVLSVVYLRSNMRFPSWDCYYSFILKPLIARGYYNYLAVARLSLSSTLFSRR